MEQTKETKEKIVLISGCSSGIGLAIASLLAKEPGKYRVYATMRDLSKKDKLVEAAKTELDKSLFLVAMDVNSDVSVAQAVSTVVAKEGRVDVVVCNAGYALLGMLETTPVDEAKKIFETNVWGVVRLVQAVLPYMRKQKSGKVIAMSSTNGIQAEPGLDFYAASKFALEALFEAQAPLMRSFEIYYTLVEAGMVQSDIINNAKAVLSAIPKRVLSVDDNGFYNQFLEGYTNLFEQNFMFADPVEDLAKLFQTIIETPQPNLRYQYGQGTDETAKSKLVDPTGNSMVEYNKNIIGYIMPQ